MNLKKYKLKKENLKSNSNSKNVFDSVLTGIEESMIFRVAAESFFACKKRYGLFISTVLLDFVFIFINMLLIGLIQLAMLAHLEPIMVMAGETTGGLVNSYDQTTGVASGLSMMSNTQEFQSHISSILYLVVLMVVCLYVCMVVFEGISWFISSRISGRKEGFFVFWKNFALQTLPFYLIFSLLAFVSVRMILSVRMNPLVSSEGVINFFFVVCLAVLLYFATLSYVMKKGKALGNLKEGFKHGVYKFPKLIQGYVLIIILLIIVDIILTILYFDPVIMLVLGLLVFFPVTAYAKVVLFKISDEVLFKDAGAISGGGLGVHKRIVKKVKKSRNKK